MAAGVRDWHPVEQAQWEIDCVGFHGEVLHGKYAHYCDGWDYLPIDETCTALFSSCTCYFPEWGPSEEVDEVRESLCEAIDDSFKCLLTLPNGEISGHGQSPGYLSTAQEQIEPTRDHPPLSPPPRSGSPRAPYRRRPRKRT